MPGLDGVETAAHIKRRGRTHDVPIIFLTAAGAEPDHAFRGYAAGAVDYIAKPFDPWVLRAKVAVFVDLYLKNHQLREQATLLRRQLGGTASEAAVVAELSGRLAAVGEQAAGLAGAAPPAPTAAAVKELRQRLAHLRETVDALPVEPTG